MLPDPEGLRPRIVRARRPVVPNSQRKIFLRAAAGHYRHYCPAHKPPVRNGRRFLVVPTPQWALGSRRPERPNSSAQPKRPDEWSDRPVA